MRGNITSGLLSGTSLMALSFALQCGMPMAAKAQTAPPPAEIEELVVTGTRLTSGFETPTPVTVLSAENLFAAAPTNIVSALVQLPALATTTLSSTSSPGTSTGGINGQSLLNLRNLGTNRNLVLLDGRRLVATNAANSIDVNTLPQNLVSRVDIVTGGASAAYGSDAVAGVVNFVLDTKFVGLKGEVGGGISAYGNLGNYKASLAWGDSFADDRLHIIAGAQYVQEYGVSVKEASGRKWFDNPVGLIPNTLSSSPTNIIIPNIRSSVGADGGLITNTILKGTQFLAGGTPAPFNYGYNSGTGFQSGGDGSEVHYNFSPDQWRTTQFVHAEYELTADDLIYVEGGHSFDDVDSKNQIAFETGSGNAFTMFSGNPFIPASIQATMTANKIASFTFGRYLTDYPVIGLVGKTRSIHETIGFKGEHLFGSDWHYDVSYSSGHTHQYLAQTNLPIAPNIYAAADAVTNPNTGQIVCRSQFYTAAGVFVPAGTGLSPGCKPINFFGVNSVAPSAIPYTIGNSWKLLFLGQQVAQANLSGDLGDDFQLGAGPIAVAGGFEYRKESANQITDPLSPTTIDFTGVRGGPAALANKLGPYRFYNPLPFHGAYDDKEGFAEVGIPLLKDRAFAKTLNADLAVRHTEYSTAGGVTTWKVGGDWQVIEDVRFRGTVSRDIRAPNLLELFNSATQFTQNYLYPSSTKGTTTPSLNIIAGNPNLKPERALTQTYGVVLTPTFVDGLSFSADYYSIKIDGAIASVGAQQTIDNCAAGFTDFCSNVTFANNFVTVRTPSLNLNVVSTAGIDLEASYKTSLFGNPLQFHVLSTHLTRNFSQAPNAPLISTLGGDNAPRWRATGNATYSIDDWKLFVQERYISPALMDATKVEGVYTNNNHIPAVFYTDMTITYKMAAFGMSDEIYLTINNLFDRDPPLDIGPPSSFSVPNSINTYDRIGRMFNMGLRFKF